MTAKNEIKAGARKAAYGVRKVAHGQGLDEAACDVLAGYLNGLDGIKIVSGYMPIRTEISPLPVMAGLVARGLKVCVPVIKAAGQPLSFHQWTPCCALVAGPFGAMVPEDGVELEPDLLITPLLSFDTRGYRLGYGGGFYDRTLEGLRLVRPTRAIGFAYGAQQVAEVPIEPTDQRLDAVVTEAGVIHRS